MKKYDHLNKNLRAYKVEVDKEKLWEQTAHAIPQKKKRRPLVIPFLLGALLLSGSLAYYHTPGFRLPVLKENDNHAFADRTNRELNVNANTLQNLPDEKNTAFAKGVTEQKEGGTKDLNKNPEYSSNYSHTNSSNPFTGGQSAQNKNTSATEEPDQSGLSLPTTLENPGEVSGIAAPEITPDHMHLQNIADRVQNENKTIAWSTDWLDPLPLSPVTGDFDKDIAGLDQTKIIPVSPRRNIFSLYILQGFGFTNLSFHPGDAEAEEMKNFLVPVTRSLESISTTVRGNVLLPKGFSVSLGIASRKLTSETRYQYTLTDRTVVEGTTTIVIDEQGRQHLVSGNLGSTHYQDIESTRYTTHQDAGVELTLHKTLLKFHRTRFNGYVKAGANFMYRAEGSAFTREQELVRFEDAQNPYRLSTPYTFGVGIDVQYRLSPKWILAGAAGIDQWNIHHQDYNQLRWKHTIYFLSLGVGYVL